MRRLRPDGETPAAGAGAHAGAGRFAHREMAVLDAGGSKSLAGRISSPSERLFILHFLASHEKNPAKIILDAHKLEYISSVGLRVVLKIKKTLDNTEVINASLEVYDIFEMTGFTDILTVKKSLRDLQSMIDRSCHETKMEEIYAERYPAAWLEAQIDTSLCMTKDDY